VLRIQVRYYHKLRDLACTNSETVSMDPESTVGDLVHRVMVSHPAMLPLRRSLLVARNDEYARGQEVLGENDVVDLMPPVSGG
jgi:molybdopterin converting factor small subunit